MTRRAAAAGLLARASPSLPPGRLLGDALNLATACAGRCPRSAPARPADPGADRRRRHRRPRRRLEVWPGRDDFLLLEMEGDWRQFARPEHGASAHAHWGALPALPGVEAVAVRELLAELGVLLGDLRALRPTYDERYLCAVPQERLYRDGLWQEGLWPQIGASAGDRAQYAQFNERMAAFRDRRAFTVPMARGDARPNCWRSTASACATGCWRRSSIRHRCTGMSITPAATTTVPRARETSAWAGIHYFACRSGGGR